MAKKNKSPEKVDAIIQQSITGVEKNTPVVEAEKLAEKEAKELAEKEDEAKELAEKEDEAKEKTYIMKVTHLSWGPGKQNHFYAYDKPLISKKTMGKKYGEIIDVWLKEKWIEQGKY